MGAQSDRSESNGFGAGDVSRHSQAMIQVTRAIAFGIAEHGYRCGVPITIPSGEQKDRHWTPVEIFPEDGEDLTTNEFVVVGAFDLGRSGAHDRRATPATPSNKPCNASQRLIAV
jgi:hypothetical protein